MGIDEAGRYQKLIFSSLWDLYDLWETGFSSASMHGFSTLLKLPACLDLNWFPVT